MEGSYNKVFLAKGNIPAESYTFFIDILLDTIRYVGSRVLWWTEGAWTLESDSPELNPVLASCSLERMGTSVLFFYELELVMRLWKAALISLWAVYLHAHMIQGWAWHPDSAQQTRTKLPVLEVLQCTRHMT